MAARGDRARETAPRVAPEAPGLDRVRLEGTALHAGGPASVELCRAGGGIVVVQRGISARLEELEVVRADAGVTLGTADTRLRLDLVEHLLAALAALGVRGGIEIRTDDGELPLLDGGARVFAQALRAIGAPAGEPPTLVVVRPAVLRSETAEYRFEPDPVAGVELSVEVDFPPPIGRQEAAWGGDPYDFVARVAPARTFGWVRDHAALLAAGRARGVDLASVLVLDDRGAVVGCSPALPGEAARHKLLDLIGDLGFYGGPPSGRVHASRPAHAATHRVVREALRTGVLARVGCARAIDATATPGERPGRAS